MKITRSNPGWLAKCPTCGWERYMPTEKGIDRVTRVHRQNCKPTEGTA